jgi:hypothetical protein
MVLKIEIRKTSKKVRTTKHNVSIQNEMLDL